MNWQEKIYTLLDRKPIHFGTDEIQHSLDYKVVLVTGAAGAIGTQLVMNLLQSSVQKLILLDQSESALYALMQEIPAKSHVEIHWLIADITDKYQIEEIFSIHKPLIVYHLAAYKNIPMLERNPIAAIHNNIIGTSILASAALEHGVHSFIFSSTDKSQNPSSYMGLSKRIGEIYLESLNQHCQTHSISSRFFIAKFRNILDTPSSVFAIFQQKIAKRETIQLTHPESFRYFMSRSEAAEFMYALSLISTDGGTFALKIPKPTYIFALAKEMIQLENLTLNKDISIQITGLRAGENPYETDIEEWGNLTQTTHPLIFQWKYAVPEFPFLAEIIQRISKTRNLSEMLEIIQEIITFPAHK